MRRTALLLFLLTACSKTNGFDDPYAAVKGFREAVATKDAAKIRDTFPSRRLFEKHFTCGTIFATSHDQVANQLAKIGPLPGSPTDLAISEVAAGVLPRDRGEPADRQCSARTQVAFAGTKTSSVAVRLDGRWYAFTTMGL